MKKEECLINSKTFSSLIDHLKDEEVEIFKTEKEVFRLKCGNFTCDLKTISENSFPIPDFNTQNYNKISLPISLLIKINKRFKDFTQTSTEVNKTSLNVLNGINIKTNDVDNNIDVCSTDSYRVVYGKFKYNGPKFNLIIIPSTLNNIISFFKSLNQDVNLYISENNIIFKVENFVVKSRLINGNYPNVLQWFNTIPELKFLINKESLLQALDRSILLSSTNLRTILLTINNQKLIIEYNDGDKGSSKEIIDIENLSNKNMEFGVDIFLFKSIIKNIEDEKLEINLINSLKPIIIKGVNSDTEFNQLTLPTRAY